MRRRGVPARGRSRRSATTSRPTGRRPSTASRSSRSGRSRGHARPAGRRRATTQARYIEAVVSTETRRGAGRLDLPAQRQPARHREIPLQARLDGPADRPRPRPAGAGGAAGAGRRLQRHPRRRATRTDPAAWAGDALFLPQTRARFRELLNLGLTDAFRGLRRPGRALHLLGLSGRRLAEEQRHPHRPPAALAAGRRPARPAVIDKHVRAWEKPSDHVPVWVDLRLMRAARPSGRFGWRKFRPSSGPLRAAICCAR